LTDVCPECAHEWLIAPTETKEEAGPVFKDTHGDVLSDGDSVTVIKEFKIRGASSVVRLAPSSKLDLD